MSRFDLAPVLPELPPRDGHGLQDPDYYPDDAPLDQPVSYPEDALRRVRDQFADGRMHTASSPGGIPIQRSPQVLDQNVIRFPTQLTTPVEQNTGIMAVEGSGVIFLEPHQPGPGDPLAA